MIDIVTNILAVIGGLTVAYQCHRLLYPPAERSHRLPDVNNAPPMPPVKPPRNDKQD